VSKYDLRSTSTTWVPFVACHAAIARDAGEVGFMELKKVLPEVLIELGVIILDRQHVITLLLDNPLRDLFLTMP
jgi:hypothetical protein